MAERWTGEAPQVEPPVSIARAPVVPEDFALFYRRELPRLVALAAAIAGASHAEEIAQEALLRAHQRWERIGRFDRPGAWARRVTINLSTSARRRDRVEARVLARLAARPDVAALPPEVDGFWRLVRQLPKRQAAAVALFYLEDLSVAELAAALGCAEGTAKAHLHKARHTLAARLATEEADR